MLTVGNEIPMKKPNTTPTIVTTTSLMLSLGFLCALQKVTHGKESTQGSIEVKSRLLKKQEKGSRANLRLKTGSFAMA
jgi:hypothetical protein